MAYNSLVQKPSTDAAVFQQQLNEMEKSWRNGENERNLTATTALLNKPANLNIFEAGSEGGLGATELNREDLDDSVPCESPSYLTTGEVLQTGQGDLKDNNPPLPPRNRLKPTLPNQKRHVRKHALIIPATGTLRALDKLNSNQLSEANRLRLKTVADKSSKMDLHSDTNLNSNSDSKINFGALSKLQVVESAPQSPSLQIYQNFSMIPHASDTASINFESIVERNDLNHVPDHFEGSNLQTAHRAYVASGGDCDRVDGVSQLPEASETDDRTPPPVLSNSVSCEDLLEFSEKKPNGRERGAESDEVRIMIKVLGAKVRNKRRRKVVDD